MNKVSAKWDKMWRAGEIPANAIKRILKSRSPVETLVDNHHLIVGSPKYPFTYKGVKKAVSGELRFRGKSTGGISDKIVAAARKMSRDGLPRKKRYDPFAEAYGISRGKKK